MSKEAWEISAANELDEMYTAIVAGCKPGGGWDYAGYKVELWIPETMEVIEQHFTFSMNPAARSDAPPGTDNVIEDARTGLDASGIFCPLVGLDGDHFFRLYGHGNYGKPINLDYEESLIKGKEVGVAVGDWYGTRRIKAFIPVSDLSAISVPD